MGDNKQKLCREQLITAGDLYNFKNDLLIEFKRLLKEVSGQPTKKRLKSFEIRKLLNISPNTLANLRINDTLPFTKIGGVTGLLFISVNKTLPLPRQIVKHKPHSHGRNITAVVCLNTNRWQYTIVQKLGVTGEFSIVI